MLPANIFFAWLRACRRVLWAPGALGVSWTSWHLVADVQPGGILYRSLHGMSVAKAAWSRMRMRTSFSQEKQDGWNKRGSTNLGTRE